MDLDCRSAIQSEEISKIVEELKVNDNLITKEHIKYVEINDDEINIHLRDFINCIEIGFVIKSNEDVEVYLVEFE